MESKKIALITGANKGLGFEISRQLGKQNILVLIGARNIELGKAARNTLRNENIEAEFVQIDITDNESIDKAFQTVEKQFGKLDILVNNAGILPQDNQLPGSIESGLLKQIFETNFFAQVAVTQKFIPLLKKSSSGRIVNMSSSLGSITSQSNANYKYYLFNMLGYNASKAALNMFTVLLAKELKDTSIKVNSADPDWCKTDMGGLDAPYTTEQGAATAVWLSTFIDDYPNGGFFNNKNINPW